MNWTLIGLLLSFSVLGAGAPSGEALRSVSLVVDSKLGQPGQYGLKDLTAALASRGYKIERAQALSDAGSALVILAGLPDSPGIRRLATGGSGIALPSEPEALLVKGVTWNGKTVLFIYGADDRGLMYAALDVAHQVRLANSGADPLASVQEASEKPAVRERGISKSAVNQSEFESYLYSEEYWSKYLDMLARNRYNNFVLILGYASAGYLEPPYPFLFDTAEFPRVRVIGITKQEQARRLEAFRRILRMTHERGMDFTLGLWTHIYRSQKPAAGLVDGLNDDALIPYTQAALKRLLELLPGIDRLQFRVHVESALNLPQQAAFWNSVFDTIKRSGQKIKIDMRAKAFEDDLMESALTSGLPIRLTTKFWGEQMGLPYHPTHIEWRDQYNRRHSYADLLRYPKRYEILWRLWNHGTTRIFLWGDPDYVRRFVGSTHLYDAPGFEVYEPLAWKMAYHRGPTYELLAGEHRYYRWEFERYWYFYELFGRLGYNPDTPARVWQREFENRFGGGAAPLLERAYATASQILPRIVAYNLSDLSAGNHWAEKQRWGDLDVYASAAPSDTAQFVGIGEAARLYLAGEPSGRIWPQQSSAWFAKTADAVLGLLKQASQESIPNSRMEFASTVRDMKMLANLALYHSQRIPAGYSYALFERTQDLNALNDAIRFEKKAIESWSELVKLAEGVYPQNLIMGRAPLLVGSWKDELDALEKEMTELERRRDAFRPQIQERVKNFKFGDGPAGPEAIRIGTDVKGQRYSYLNGGHGWLDAALSPKPDTGSKPGFVWGPPEHSYTLSAFATDLPNGYYELKFVMEDTSKTPRDRGPMWIGAEGKAFTDHFRVPAGKAVEKTLEAHVVNGRLGITFNCDTSGTWLVNSLEITRIGPVIAHVSVRRAEPGRDLAIRATAGGPVGITGLRCVYGSSKAGYTSIPMEPAGKFVYAVSIPGSAVLPGLQYGIEAEDAAGRIVRHAPVGVLVQRDHEPPTVTHARIEEASAGSPMMIEADVADPSGVGEVLLRYRCVNQTQEFTTIRMLPAGLENRYRARIPARDVNPAWDLMYFIEAFDVLGNGRIYPDVERETPYVVIKVRR